MELYLNHAIPLKLAKKINILVIVIIIFEFILFPAPVLAKNIDKETDLSDVVKLSYLIKESEPVFNALPENSDNPVKSSGKFPVTAYNSEVGQCDDSPCITANGFNLCEHGVEDSIATNMLPFGTKVRLPELFGDRIFVVRDRMNKRYYERFDIWMLDHSEAVKFGIKYTTVEILK